MASRLCAAGRAIAAFAFANSAWCQPYLYVTNQNSNSLSVIDVRTGGVTSNPPAGFSPAGVAVHPDGIRVYSASPNSNAVTVYSLQGNLLTPTSGIAIGQIPLGVAVDDARVYVTLHGNAGLGVISTATNQQTAAIRVGFGPSAVAIAPSTGRVYVANTYSNTVSVVDPGRIGTIFNPVLANVAVPDSPVALAVAPNGVSAWVVSSARPILSRINLGDNAVEMRIPLPFPPAGVAISPDNSRVYVMGYGPRVVAVETASGRVGQPIDLPACNMPRCVAMSGVVSADSRTLYVTNTSRNQVAVIDTERNQVTSNINVYFSPRAIALSQPLPVRAAVEADSVTASEVQN